MPAITLGYSQIEQQIRVIRRRRNWLTVQQAVYVCGGAMLLGVALLVVLAVRSERLTFTVAFWATLASILLIAVAAVRSIWRQWIRAAETPRWIDRAAALDDRLATLVAHHGTTPPARLMATLVSQLFALRYRWEPATLVPRRVPRSLYFFLSAVAALTATGFLQRPPATPQPFPHTTTVVPHHQNAPADAAGGRLARIQGRTTGAAQSAHADAGTGGGAATERARHGARPQAGTDAQSAQAAGSQMSPGTRDGRSAARDQMPPASSADAARDQRDPALPDRVQDMLRQALRQPPLDHEGQDAGRSTQAKRGKPGEQPGSSEQQEQHARAEGLPHQGQALPRPNAATPPQQPTDNVEGGRGTNRGGGAGQGTSGIYGAQERAAGGDNASRKFELKLTLLGQSSGATLEPQRSKRGGVDDLGIPADQPTTDVPLNSNQRADEPLVRGEIPAEHEAMIKRIFSRSE